MEATRQKLSATVITLNEEERVRDCLEGVRWADEIVVLDSFSTDRTVEICREYTERVLQEKLPSTAARRARALELAEHEWVLSLDADERVSTALAEEIQEALSRPDLHAYGGFRMPRLTLLMGRWMRHGSWHPNYQLRLTRKSCTTVHDNAPHDVIEVTGRVGTLRNSIEHRQPDALSDQLAKAAQYSNIFAETKHAKGATTGAARIFLHPILRFLRNYVLRLGFLDGTRGLIIGLSGAFHSYQKQAKLWELSQKEHGAGEDRPERQEL